MNKAARILGSLLLLAVATVGLAPVAFAQSVTTGTLTGMVLAKDESVALPGARVTATHLPTGTVYTSTTRGDGRFTLLNVRVGGPYTISVAMDGFRTAEATGVNVALGETFNTDFALEIAAIEEAITVTAEAPLVDTTQAGTGSNVTLAQIAKVPTLDRSLEDLAKTSLYFNLSGGAQGSEAGTISVAGRNNRYNTIQVDGAVNNDLFGLSPTGSPNGQAEAQPISLEAIQEVQLLVTPYDVRQGGFSGGGINAITKSGSNAWHGSVFYNTRDNDLVGDGPTDQPFGTFSEDQYGLSLGGPIVADKAFFFVAGELQRKETPSGFSAASIGRTAEAQRFVDILRTKYGYDPGSIDEFTRATDNDNYFVRLDFNVGSGSQLTVRHNLVDAENDIWNGSSTLFLTSDRPYNIRPKTNATVAQLNSVLSGDFYNEARIGFTTVETIRDGSTRFPTVQVDLPGGVSLEAGRERFSTANELDQDILEINDDLTFIRGNHTLTVGTHNELFSFRNLFIRDLFGAYNFDSLNNFEAGRADTYDHSFSRTGDPLQAAEFDVEQYGLYAGDQWRVRDNLTVTYGVRADYLKLPDSPTYNPQVEALYGVRTDEVPDSNLILSPRVGFNWDPTAEGKQQVRGGIGLFSGRAPYVWISNQYGNTGNEFQRLNVFRADDSIVFVPDPDNQPKQIGSTLSNEVALTDPDFEMPTVMRANLAYDYELPYGLFATAELTYTDVQKDIQYQDLNLRATGATGVGGRPLYTRISTSFSGAYFLTNSEDGESTTAGLQIRNRDWAGFSFSTGYLWQDATEVYPGTSSQASSNFLNTSVVDPQNPGTQDATYLVEHRLTSTLSYDFDLGPLGSSVSLYFNRQSGRPYSTTFGGGGLDVNGDNVRGNDLFYVPGSQGEVIFVNSSRVPLADQAAAWAAFDAYVQADDSLKGARGRNVGRNTGRSPWTTQLDLRWALELPISKVNTQLTFDVLNLLNLIDSDKGVFRYTRFGEVSPVNYQGVDAATGKLLYTVNFSDPSRRFDIDNLRSRWQAKLGLRVGF